MALNEQNKIYDKVDQSRPQLVEPANRQRNDESVQIALREVEHDRFNGRGGVYFAKEAS